MTSDELKKILSRPGVARRNPDLLVGGVAPSKPEPHSGTALGLSASAQARGGTRIRTGGRNRPSISVALIVASHRRLDGDNFISGAKPIRDAIARWFGLDDNDDVIEWQYGQIRCSGSEGTIVVVRRIQ